MLKIDGRHKLQSLFLGESSGFIESSEQLVEKGVKLINVKVARAVEIVGVEDLIDEHPKYAVVQAHLFNTNETISSI